MQNVLSYFHLFVSIVSSYTYFTQSFLYPCVYLIGFCCSLDMFLHITQIRKLRLDMFLHHICVLFIVAFFHRHLSLYVTEELKRDHLFLLNQIISIEISTIFLILQQWKRTIRYVTYCNNVFFITSFSYYRIYKYTFYVILHKPSYIFFVNISQSPVYFYGMYFSLYGLCFLHYYWFYLIVVKMYHLQKERIKTRKD